MSNKEILEKAVQEEKEKQSRELVIDFDQAFHEERQRAITVKWEGREYKIPDTPPEWFRLMSLRNKGVFSDEDNEIVFRKLFGDEFADKINKHSEESNWMNMKMANQNLMAPIIDRWFGYSLSDTSEKKKKTQGSSSGAGEE